MTARHGVFSGAMIVLLAMSSLGARPAPPLVDWNTGSGFMDGGFAGFVNDMLFAPDGSGDLYVGGKFSSFNGAARSQIARLNSNGSIDDSFDVGSGFAFSVNAGQCRIMCLAQGPTGSGDVYAGGWFDSYKGTAANFLTRLNSDGSLDAGFATGTGFNSDVLALASATDDDVYVAGEFSTYKGAVANRLVRLNSDGTVDMGFNVGSGFSSGISRLFLASDGSGDLYVNGGGAYNGTPTGGLIRLNSDGSIDTAFNVGTGFNNGVFGLVAASDGSGDVIVAGQFTSFNGTAANHIIRLNSDGTVDTAFDFGSGFAHPQPGAATVMDLALSSDGSGDIFAGGQFAEYRGSTRNHIARINPDGTLDTGFNLGSQLNHSVLKNLVTADGNHLFMGGAFSGVLGNRIARVSASEVIIPTWVTGDLFAGVHGFHAGFKPQCRVFTSSGDFKDDAIQPGQSADAVACGFNLDHSKLYATVTNSTVVVFDSVFPHAVVQTINTGAQSPGGAPESIVFASNGGFYVGQAAGDKDLHRYNAAGVFQQKYNVAVENTGCDHIDLAKDQKTMFYTSEGRTIFRFNVLTGAQMKQFAKIPGQGTAHALRLLPPGDGTGGLIVADRLNIKRLSGTGQVAQTYDVAGVDSWTYLALDSNGTSFWAVGGSRIYRFAISSGALEAGPLMSFAQGPFGLCVKGAYRAAID